MALIETELQWSPQWSPQTQAAVWLRTASSVARSGVQRA